MQPQPIHLPHSGYTVPHTGYTVTSLKQRQGRDGVAFTATLRRNGHIIGTIENDGHGGPDTFYPSAADGHRTERAALQAYAEQSTDERGKPVNNDEFLLGALVTEYELARDIKRYAAKSMTMLRQIDDYEGDGGPAGMPGVHATTAINTAYAQDRARLLAELSHGTLKCGPYGWWQIFNGTRWEDVTTRPAYVDPDQFC